MPRTTVKSQVEPSYRTPRFHEEGDSFTGIVLKEPVSRQKTKFGTQDKEFWDEEKTRPRMEHIYTFLMVEETHDYNPKGCFYCKKVKVRDDEDNGGRILYASDKQHWTMQKAFATVAKPEIPGWIKLTYSGDDLTKKKDGFEAPKLWTAEYRICTDEEVEMADEFLGYVPDVEPKANTSTLDALLQEDENKKLTLAQLQDLV